MSHTNTIVVDANVWIDYLFGNRPGNEEARRFFVQAARSKLKLVIPPHTLSVVFYMIQKLLKDGNRLDNLMTPEEAAASARAAAWAIVDFVMEIATVGPIDQADAIIASKQRGIHGDFEDDLVIACAMRCKSRLLVTNDEKLIKHSPVATMNAHDACALLASEME